jgi:hypothetical protein
MPTIAISWHRNVLSIAVFATALSLTEDLFLADFFWPNRCLLHSRPPGPHEMITVATPGEWRSFGLRRWKAAERKQFFFEKKNQKTFGLLGVWWGRAFARLAAWGWDAEKVAYYPTQCIEGAALECSDWFVGEVGAGWWTAFDRHFIVSRRVYGDMR